MKVCVIGGGFVGLTTAVVLCEQGHSILLVEKDLHRRNQLTSGIVPFYEPGLQDALSQVTSQNLIKISDWQDLRDFQPEVIVVCGPTPSKMDGSIDLSMIIEIFDSIVDSRTNCRSIAIKSTVLPGTVSSISRYLAKEKFFEAEVAMVPEFLREGTALADARHPDRIVIGASSQSQLEQLQNVFSSKNVRIVSTTPFNAEITKYASNTFLATCISFVNEFFSLFNSNPEFDLNSVLEGWHSDRRFSVFNEVAAVCNYLSPGFGFGGSCFPKDIRATLALFDKDELSRSILGAVYQRNSIVLDEMVEWLVLKLEREVPVLVAGLGFKEHTDDLRESPSVIILERLRFLGYRVFWFDLYLDSSQPSLPCNAISTIDGDVRYQVLLTNNDIQLRSELYRNLNPLSEIYLLRYQDELPGFLCYKPRQPDKT